MVKITVRSFRISTICIPRNDGPGRALMLCVQDHSRRVRWQIRAGGCRPRGVSSRGLLGERSRSFRFIILDRRPDHQTEISSEMEKAVSRDKTSIEEGIVRSRGLITAIQNLPSACSSSFLRECRHQLPEA